MQETTFIEKSISLESGTQFDGKGKIYTGTKTLSEFYTENGLYVCDLTKEGITPCKMRSRGYCRSVGGGHSELFIDNKPYSISRYPRTGSFLKIKNYKTSISSIDGQESGVLEDGFFYEDETPKTWQETPDIWVHGYWCYDWANSYECIDIWDKETGYIKTKAPHGNYGYRKGQRFYFLNVKEEVKGVGDYAIDYQTNKLYFLPFEKNQTQDVRLSVATYPCIELIDKENIVVENLEINGFVGDAIFVKNCKNIIFRNCKIYNIGGRAAVVEHSENVVFENCEIYHIGETGIDVKGGDRLTLTSCNCGVRNCHLYDVSAWSRTYTPAIYLTGVGLFAQGNTVHNCPHSAILYFGNEIKITENVIYNVLWETGDAGAIYTGRDYTFRGNEVSDNLICLTGGVGIGTMGIYNDDCVSGTKMERNVFYKVERALFMGGGVDFVVRDNVCVECTPAIEIDGRGSSDHPQWRENMQTIKNRFYCIKNIKEGGDYEDGESVSGVDEPYASRYPELKKLHEAFETAEDLPLIPASGEIVGNVMFGWGIYVHWAANKRDFEENFVCENNVNVLSRCDLKEYMSEKQYAKYLQALEIEKELNAKIKI